MNELTLEQRAHDIAIAVMSESMRRISIPTLENSNDFDVDEITNLYYGLYKASLKSLEGFEDL